MANETRALAEYAAKLRYEDLPAEVIERAKQCIADTVAVVTVGNHLPWGKMIVAYARRAGPGGKSRILGAGGPGVQAGAAALANGTLAHSFEMDNIFRPNVGVHPGGCILTAALAVAQDRGGIGGRDLIAAFVAACEVTYRIGKATKHSNEHRGFHAPGTVGGFGGATAVAHLLKLDAEGTTNALGIAGSLASGLLEFARAGNGGMVKRLHMGRAAESGVLAGSLAASGYTGPQTVIEGEYGFLHVFCEEFDLGALTQGLGSTFETMKIGFKRYACHFTSAHSPVEAVVSLRKEHGFSGRDVETVEVVGPKLMLGRHNIPAPTDVMLAQYSVPFCTALALYRDVLDPRSFGESALSDKDVVAMSRRVVLTVDPAYDFGAKVKLKLKDGRQLEKIIEREKIKGMPPNPLSPDDLKEKFLRQAGGYCRNAEALYERLSRIEDEKELDWLEPIR